MALLSLALACCALGAVDKREEVVTREPPPRVSVAEVLRGPAGGFYVVATSRTSRHDVYGGSLVVVRYDRRGRRVRSFGERGVYRTRWPGRPVRALAATRQRDGKLVVVGSIDSGEERDLFVARFYDDGTLDGAFGTNGVQTVDLNDFEEANAVAVQPDGALVVAATTSSDRAFPPYPVALPEMALVRLRANGSLDEGFAGGGVLRFPPRGDVYHSFDEAVDVLVGADGTILMGANTGSNSRPDAGYWPVIARVSPDGRSSTVVDVKGDGVKLSDMTGDAESGRLYLSGTRGDDFYGTTRMWAAALTPDLALDPAFGSDGTALANYPGMPLDGAAALTRDGRGRIVLAGTTSPLREYRPDFLLARLTASGRLDRAFGRGGMMRIRFPRRVSAATGIVEQPRGRLVAIGASGRVTADRTVAIARLRNRP